MRTAITQSELTRLKSLEAIVHKGKKAFLEVGTALKEIRDSSLYKATHGTFAAYVEDKFGFKRHNAYHLIDAAEAAVDVEHVQQIENPRQAAEIAKAPQNKRASVVRRAQEIAKERGKKPTAATFKEAREEVGKVESQVATSPPAGRPSRPKRGVGIRCGNEAIDALKRIPKNDEHRDRAFQMVSDWIDRHSEVEQEQVRPQPVDNHMFSELFAVNKARVAVTQIEGIPIDNEFRDKALLLVAEWINQELGLVAAGSE